MSKTSTPSEPGDSRAIGVLQRRSTGPIHGVVRFGPDSFETLHVDDSNRSEDTDEPLQSVFARLHDYVNVDFAERELFAATLLPDAGGVTHITTAMESIKFVRVYDGYAGILLALDPDEAVEPLVDAVEDHLL